MTNSERERRLQALEAELAQLTDYARRWYQPAPITERDLARKRDERLYREAYQSLSEQERAEFEKQFGFSATIRRLAEEARKQADAAWEARELQRQGQEFDREYANRQSQVIASGYRAGTNWDLVLEQHERLEQAKRERLEERAKRELLAEAHDEELPRILATFDREELEIFNRLMERVPTQLEALEQFKASKGQNPLAEVTDPAQLYDMALDNKPAAKQEAPADIAGIQDSTTLYDIALKKAMEE